MTARSVPKVSPPIPSKQVAIAIRNVHQGYSQLRSTIASKVFFQGTKFLYSIS